MARLILQISFITFLLLRPFGAWAETPPVAANESDTENQNDPKITIHKILPSETDRRIDTFTDPGQEHFSYINPSAILKNQLVVFIPGTGGSAGSKGIRKFVTLAANEGFHFISLEYPDNYSISHVQNSDDPDCFAKARENVIFGKAPFGKLHVNEANSIEHRLIALLKYLTAHFRDEHWDQYLAGAGSVNWEKLILAGGSQGGGHAAYMAMKHKVARVIMFGAPKDFNMHFNSPAKWYSAPSETPLNRFFSFVHSADEGHGCSYQQQLENYRALQLSPKYKVINVDQASPPYDHSRLFTSTAQVNYPHGSVHQNNAYRPVWKYLLEEPVE